MTDLHGVGEYTARSVLAPTHGYALSAVDTNVERLVSRFFGLDTGERDLTEFATALTPPDRASDFLHAMLDFAAAV